jgi:antirestriction protein ArdC
MAAAFVCASLGIVPTIRHADYIGSWLEVLREDNRAIVRAASAASKASEFILAFRSGTPKRVGSSNADDDKEVARAVATRSQMDALVPRGFRDG